MIRGRLMPPPLPIELIQHDPAWIERAQLEGRRIVAAAPEAFVEVHHIGSTAIPGIKAKPVLDLLAESTSLVALDGAQPAIEELGYQWWGKLGLPGRRYCIRDDPETGRRLVQLHCFEKGSADATRHIAFRDYLIARPDLALAYEAEKIRCRNAHPSDSHTYTDCKDAWIRRIETEALASVTSPGPQ